MPRTCTFCGLLCDDYLSDAGLSRPGDVACPRAAAGLRATAAWQRDNLVLTDPQQVDEFAVRVAPRLAAAARPLILVGGCDVGTGRALVALARHCGALLASQWPSRTASGYSATLEEVCSRSDCVILVGDLPRQMPLLVERFLSGPPTLRATGTGRHLFHLDRSDVDSSAAISGPTRILCGDLLDAIVAARSRAAEQQMAVDPRLKGLLAPLQQPLADAAHVSLLWSTDEHPPLVAALHDWARLLQQTQHCVTLPLDPDPGRISFHNVCSWTTGFQPPIDFAATAPEDLHESQVRQLLEADVFDAIFVVNPHGTAPLQIPDGQDVEVIVTDQPLQSASADAAIYAAPQGHYFRGDGVSMLRSLGPLPQLPTLQQVLQHTAAAAAAGRREAGVVDEAFPC